MVTRRHEMQVIRSEERGEVLCLRIQGTIRQDMMNPEYDPLSTALGPAGFAWKVLLDLSEVEFIDSSGYSWLLRQSRAFRSAGGAMILHSISPLVMQVFTMVRAELVFQIAPDKAAALELFQGGKT
jgi:anti-anti-sigma factor